MYIWFYKVKQLKHYYYFVYDDNFIYEARFIKSKKSVMNNKNLEITLVGIGYIFLEELKKYFTKNLSFFKSVKYVYELQKKEIKNDINYKVYNYLVNNVKRGDVITYNDISRKFNIHPRYSGIIMKSNKVALLIPCHRVIKSNGSLGGYMGNNVFIKEFLLKIEGHSKKYVVQNTEC